MGNNYSVSASIKIRDEKGLIEAIAKFARDSEACKKVDFQLNSRWKGYGLDSVRHVITVLFSNAGCPDQMVWGHWVKVCDCDLKPGERVFGCEGCDRYVLRLYDSQGFLHFNSDFSASYGWEGVMTDAIMLMGPYLDDGSEISISMDEGSLEFAESSVAE